MTLAGCRALGRGMSFLDATSFRLPNSIYPPEVIVASLKPYSQHAKIRVTDITNDGSTIEVEIEQQFESRSREIKGELLNYMLASSAVRMTKNMD